MEIDVALTLAGGSLLVLALLSRALEDFDASPIALALCVGLLAGPALGVVDPSDLAERTPLLETSARITLAIALVSVALRATAADLRRALRPVGGLLGVGMAGMWLMTSLGAFLLLDVPLWGAMLLGAILTPTDPAVASTLTSGEVAEADLPRPLRRTLELESGANDGLALPFVLVAGMMLVDPAAGTLAEWAGTAGRELGVTIAVAAAIGGATGVLARAADRGGEASREWLAMLGVALALTVLGVEHLLGGTGVLGAFVAGLCFALLLTEEERSLMADFQAGATKVAMVPLFVLFGATLPLAGWEALGLPAVAFAIWVLVLRRLPVVPLALAGSGAERRSVAFLGWFGPIGVAAIYWAAYAERFDSPEVGQIVTAATLAITVSVIVQGLSATPGARLYAGRRPLIGRIHRRGGEG